MPLFPLAPRYRLDDELPWLEGVDPSRHYWLKVNGDEALTIVIPGLAVASIEAFKTEVLRFRALQPGEEMEIRRAANHCSVICVSQNCYAIATEIAGAPVWHLFDQESLESLLRTGHPDWKCSAKDMELGRRRLMQSWSVSAAA